MLISQRFFVPKLVNKRCGMNPFLKILRFLEYLQWKSIEPKILNFVSPSLNFPFRYSQWLKLYESMTKKYFLFGIFCVTRYGYVVCKNYNLSNLQASQQRTARHTLKTSRILADSCAVPHRDVLLLFTPSTPPE